MRRLILIWSFWCLIVAVSSVNAATGRVLKVLPHYLDAQGRHTLAPSLYERDAYQARLRAHPELRSGLRFDIWCKARGAAAGPVKLRLELRGTAQGDLPTQLVLESEIKPRWFSRWVSLPLTGEDYQKFGETTAWRATLWEGTRLIDEQKSFLW